MIAILVYRPQNVKAVKTFSFKELMAHVASALMDLKN